MEDTFVFSLLCLMFAIAFEYLRRTRKSSMNLPPGPPALPIIGHLHLLKQPLHRRLHALSQKYGPIISLRLGSRFVVIVSTPSAVEECFSKNDVILANRPPFLNGKYLNYNFTTVAAASYCDHWRNLRRLSAIEIFSATRLKTFADIRKDEVMHLVRRLQYASKNGLAKVELRSMFLDATFNNIMRMMAGKRYYGEDVEGAEEAQQFKDYMQEYSECSKVSNLGDLFPILQLIDYDGFVKRMTTLSKNMDIFLQRLIKEHREDKTRNSMISHLLALQETQPEYYTDAIIKGLILIMAIAGTKTSAITMEWTMANLVNNPQVLKKAREELDTQVGQERLMDESDFSKLPYLLNVVNESFRLTPTNPLLVPHYSSSDCTIGGYNIPRGTIVFANAWAIHRDPTIWEDPLSFKPERFKNEKVNTYKHMPFGVGRRACPGEPLALRVMYLTLGTLIQCFDWERIGEEEVDMNEQAATTMTRVTPLEINCKARPHLCKMLSFDTRIELSAVSSQASLQ